MDQAQFEILVLKNELAKIREYREQYQDGYITAAEWEPYRLRANAIRDEIKEKEKEA